MNKNTVSTQTLLAGFNQAYGRYKVAKNEKDSQKVFFPLFETLNWAVSIIFRLVKDDSKFSEEPLLKAIKYIRNRVHHQWTDALILSTKGMALPAELPAAFHEWLWKSLDKVPKPDKGFADPTGEKSYKKLLEGKPARQTLLALNDLFKKVI